LSNIDNVRPHLASLVDDFGQHRSELAIVEHRGNRRYKTSYGELATLAGRFAAELEARSVAPGERVLLWGANSAEWVGVFFGCLLRGVVAVALDAAGSSDFAARVIADVSPRLIAGDRALLSTLNTAVPQIAFAELDTQLPRQPLFVVDAAVTLDAPFQIVFTSGTTSEPKGIVHTHRNVLASLTPIENEIAKYGKYERFVHPLRFLHTLPLSHVFGQFMGLWLPSLLAAQIHFDTQLEPGRIIELARRERISVLIAVPRVLELLRTHLLNRFPSLVKDLERVDGTPVWRRWWELRSVHHAFGFKFWALICGGASLPPELERFWSTVGLALIQGYGMTETAALVTLNHPFKIGQGTIGKALPGREVRIGEDGEILVRGEMLSVATWQGGALRPRRDEWLATGDLAAQDDSGELRFLGRKGDVIVSPSGMNIHPADLEAAMTKQAGVRGCVVVPCETPAGIEPVAVAMFVGTEDALQAAVLGANQQLASYQQIRRILRWPELNFPYPPTGKLLRRKVAEWACATLSGRQQMQSGGEQDMLRELIAGITHELVAGGDGQRLSEDLHLDSLGRVQLQSLLEQRLGVELADDVVASIETLGGLRALVDQSLQGETTEVQDSGTASITLAEGSHHQYEQGQSSSASEQRYPHWPWSLPVQAMRIVFIEAVMRPLIWLLAAPRVQVDALIDTNGPLLLIANHVTAYDGALVLYALPAKRRRRVAIAMSGEMLFDFRKARSQSNFLLNALGPLAYLLVTALFNVFPLPRMRGFRKSFAHAGEAMDKGYSVLIFPEGHRSDDGNLQAFRPGIGLLARESNVSILPIALKGLGEMRRSGWFRSGKLSIHIGTMIAADEAADPAELTRKLEEAIRLL
jgi:long-chain acyl-CoA synthetase